LYILDIIEISNLDDKLKLFEDLMNKEDYWYRLILPSYNIQSILQPFKGKNHYRFGKKVSDEVRKKISNSLKGRKQTEKEKINHINAANKKQVFCYNYITNNFLFEFKGLRIAARVLNIKDYKYINYRLDKNKNLIVKYYNIEYNLIFKSVRSCE
jgi:hypothetical protein